MRYSVTFPGVCVAIQLFFANGFLPVIDLILVDFRTHFHPAHLAGNFGIGSSSLKRCDAATGDTF
jgi:hypothetical protein